MNATEILPGLWQGGELLPAEYPAFAVVISLHELPGGALTPFGPSALLWLPLWDGPEAVPLWKITAAVDLVEHALANHRKVLVHCLAGLNRSGLIVAAFLIRCRGMTADEAIALIRQKRGAVALSNATFVAQLRGLSDFIKHLRPVSFVAA